MAYGRVYIGTTDGTMYAYGQKSGRLLWARPLGSYIYSSAAVYDSKVYAGTYDGKFFALDAATGDVRWQRDDAQRGARRAGGDGRPGLRLHLRHLRVGGVARSVKTGTDTTTAFNARTGQKVWFNHARASTRARSSPTRTGST